MKLNNIDDFSFNTGRNIIEGKDILDDFNKNLLVKSLENKEEDFAFDKPLKVRDLVKLFDLNIDTKLLNPTYIKDKLALTIRDSEFMPLIKGTGELFSSFTDEIMKMGTQLVGDSIVIPEAYKDNLVLKMSIEKIQDMIKDVACNNVPGLKFISEINDYKEKLTKTIELSEKAIAIMNNETLLDKNIFDLPQEAQKVFIEKRNKIIESSKKLIEDIEIITKNITQMNNIIDKTKDYNLMFEQKSDSEIEDEVKEDMEKQRTFSNIFR